MRQRLQLMATLYVCLNARDSTTVNTHYALLPAQTRIIGKEYSDETDFTWKCDEEVGMLCPTFRFDSGSVNPVTVV